MNIKRIQLIRLLDISVSAKRFVFAALLAGTSGFLSAAPTLTIDKVSQRWPWNNKIDVTYTIDAGGIDLERHIGKVTLTTVVNGQTHIVFNGALNEKSSPGTHTVTWNHPPAGIDSRACQMTGGYAYSEQPVPAGTDYMIVDLRNGAVTYEGLYPPSERLAATGQELSNARYNKPKYKSTHLVLRKIPKGTYKTGDTAYSAAFLPSDPNSEATWTTDRDFYIAIFPWTSYQYWMIFDPDNTSSRPETQITLKPRPLGFVNDIRGTADNTRPPEGHTTVGRYQIIPWLNGKTGLAFDLPTEVMFEIATRAGTTTTYFWGDDKNLADRYAVCGRAGARPVYGWEETGTKLPNAWGLYDMVGSDWHWCLDSAVANDDVATRQDAFTPLSIPDSTIARVKCSNATAAPADLNPARRSAGKIGTLQNAGDNWVFRVAYIVPTTGD
jgi:formylglycine-generating enzyme required for sulfatase activity